MAVGAPDPAKLTAAGLPRPSLEGTGVGAAFSPADLRSAYKLPAEGGKGVLVAITIAYHDKDAESDLAVYREQYGLPACTEANGCLTIINQRGEAGNPPAGEEAGWGEEESLDLDMVSAACPECHILLVEAEDNQDTDLYPAVEEAARYETPGEERAAVISDSWAGPEYSGETSENHYFEHAGIPALFASGDWGYEVEYPAAAPGVVSVGGTSLKKATGTTRGWAETAWSGAGSGCSAYEAKPAWQKDEGCLKRTVADVSAVADPGTPVSVYDGQFGWMAFGGTSVATPFMAGVEALSSGAFRVAGPSAFARLGENGELFDPTEGENGYCHSYLCEGTVGYDGPTGWGTPDGVPSLPVAVTEEATALSGTEATLRGSVDPDGHATEYHFEYGETTAYGTSVPIPSKSVGPGGEYVEVGQTIGGLKGRTTYHYRITATNSEGTFHGADRVFGTTPPTLLSGLAGEIHANDATLHATVDPEGLETSFYFEYGTGTAYGYRTPARAIGSGTANVDLETVAAPLADNETYHFRIVAKNPAGTSYGGDETFTTEPAEWASESLPLPTRNSLPGLHPYANVRTGVSCISRNFCMSVGDYLSDLNQMDSELWNGKEWHSYPMAEPESALEVREVITLDVSCASESWCVAVGYYTTGTPEKEAEDLPLIEHWNGHEWAVDPVSLPEGLESASGIGSNTLDSVSCVSSTMCMAVGMYHDLAANPGIRPLVYRWTGSEWEVVAMPIPPRSSGGVSFSVNWPGEAPALGVSCVNSSWCMVVGRHNEYKREWNQPFAEVWTGNEWTTILDESPSPNSEAVYLRSVSCASTTSCVGLTYGRWEKESYVGPIARWDGRDWVYEPLPKVAGTEVSLPLVVSCTSSSVCVVGGESFSLYGDAIPTVFGWNGSTWAAQSIGLPRDESGEVSKGSYLEGMSCVSQWFCLAVGAYHFRSNEFDGLAEIYQARPTLTTEAASGVNGTAATLNGSVDPNETETRYWFEYGPTNAYGSRTEEVGIGSGTGVLEESEAIGELEPGSVYHYRIVATNAGGTTRGRDREFSTSLWGVRHTADAEGAEESALEWTSCASSTDCEATGYWKDGSGTTHALAERWDGSAWSIQSTPDPAGAGSVDLEWVACSSARACEGTGHYEDAAGVTRTLAEHWDGSEWSLQSTPGPEGAKESVLDQVACTSATECTAVGWWKDAAGTIETLAEHWDGTRWQMQAIPDPEGPVSARLIGLSCAGPTFCEATGYQEDASGLRSPLVERWNGVAWTLQSAPTPQPGKNAYLYGASCTSTDACTAVGFYISASGHATPLAERWDGTAWSVQTMPTPEGAQADYLYGVSCTSSTDCEASGKYEKEFAFRPLTEVWDGTSWTVQSAPAPEGARESSLNGGVSCTSPGACTSVGHYVNGAGTTVTLAERWDGTGWEAQSSPNPEGGEGTYLSGEPSCTSTISCEATGYHLTPSGRRPTAERWNGMAWTSQAVPMPTGAKEASLTTTSCTAASACTAAGNYVDAAGTVLPLAERWDGAGWSVQSAPTPAGATEAKLTSVFCTSSTACEATGYYKNSSGVWVALAERWNGTGWALQSMVDPSGANETRPEGVSCSSSTSCEATGYYKNSSGTIVALAETWNGSTWTVQSTPNPEGAKETRLYGLSCTSSANCEAMGFYQPGSGAVSGLAEHWDGTKWSLQSTPAPEGAGATRLYGVSCVGSVCEAAGYHLDGSGHYAPLAERWSGTAWSAEPSAGPEGAKNAYPSGVACVSATSCVATGYFIDGAGIAHALAESRGGIAPVVATRSATSLTQTGATLNGTVVPKASSAEYFFEYGATTSYGNTTSAVKVGSSPEPVEVSGATTGLEAGHTYHFRLVAGNATGTSRGEDQVFKAKVKPPTVTTEAASGVISGEATLNGSVDPEGTTTGYYFEYGPTAAYGMTTPEMSAGSGTNAVKESATLHGLEPETTYHFRIVATNGESAVVGKNKDFLGVPAEWSVQTTPGSFTGFLQAVSCASSQECIAIGSKYESGQQVIAERWDGTGWSMIAAPEGKESPHGISCASSTFCVAATSSLETRRWNGTGWSTVTAVMPTEAESARLTAISCTSPGWCVGVGSYVLPGWKSHALAEAYDGEKWSILPTPTEEGAVLSGVSCASSSFCKAVGNVRSEKSLALDWDGTEWSAAVAPERRYGGLISCVSSSACMKISGEDAESWNGSTWSAAPVPTPEGASYLELESVSCVAAADCIATGYYETLEEGLDPLVERWDGGEWTVEEPPGPGGLDEGRLSGVSCISAARCTAVGMKGSYSEGLFTPLAERFE